MTTAPNPEPASIPLGPSPREIQVGLRWNIIAGMLAMIWLTLPGTPLTMLMECLGAEAFQIGLLVSIQQFAMILQVPGALLSGLFRRRKGIWAVLSMMHRLVWFAPVLLLFGPRYTGSNGILLLIGMVTVSSVFVQLSISTWNGWMADLVPEHQRSRFWGTRQSLLWAVYTPFLLLFGFLLDYFPDPRQPGGHYFGFALVFALGALAGCLDIIAHLKVPEPPPVPSATPSGLWRRITLPFRNHDFSYLTAGMVVWYFNLGLVGSFSIIFLTRKFGFSYSQLAILNLSASLAVIAGGLLWGFFIKRVGSRSFLVSTLLVAPVFAFVWFLLRDTTVSVPLPWFGAITIFQPMLILFVSHFLSSLFYSGIGLCQLNMLSVLTPREDRSMAMAVHWTAIGLGASLGPLLGGWLVDWFELRFPTPLHPLGFQFGFMHMLGVLHAVIIWVGVLPFIRRLRATAGELPVGATLSRMFIGNPLRLVGNILLMDTASTSRERVRAVRGMGRQRFDLAVTDLIDQLHNPATSVREAAVSALGRIGSCDAVAALVTELGKPDTGLTLPLLRALQQAADPAALPAVLPWINHSSPEIARAAIRALSAFRDGRAVGPLIEKINTVPDATLMAACAEALEILGDPIAIRPILRRLPYLLNPVLQRTLAVAVTNLFGSRDTFYRLLENESRHPGTLTDALLDDVSTAIRSLSHLDAATFTTVGRHLQSLRRRLSDRGTFAAAVSLRELSHHIGGALYRVPLNSDPARWTATIAAQNERYGLVLELIEMLTTDRAEDRATDQPDVEVDLKPDTHSAATPTDEMQTTLPLALHLLTTVLKEERRKRR